MDLFGNAKALLRLRKILDLAESDPEAFRAECRKIAEEFGLRTEELYQAMQDPNAKRELQNIAIQKMTKFARRALGL